MRAFKLKGPLNRTERFSRNLLVSACYSLSTYKSRSHTRKVTHQTENSFHARIIHDQGLSDLTTRQSQPHTLIAALGKSSENTLQTNRQLKKEWVYKLDN